MATTQNLIDTYLSNPTLQSRYTQQQYLDLFGFGQSTPTPTPPPTPTPTPPSGPVNIIGQNLNQGGGGGGIQELQQTYTRTEPKGPKFDPNIDPSFTLTGKGRLDPMGSDIDYFQSFRAQNDPRAFTSGLSIDKVGSDSRYFEEPSLVDKGITAVKDFFGKFSSPKVQGTLGTRLANQPRLPLPLSIAAYGRSPFNPKSATYNPFMEQQLNFLEGATGTKITGTSDNLKFTEGQAMIGRNPNTGALQYGPGTVLEGKNVISAFGSNDYGVALDKFGEKMEKYGTVDGVFDVKNFTPKQFARYQQYLKEKQALVDLQITKQIKEKERLEEIERIKNLGKGAYDPNIHGPTDYGRGSDGQQSYDMGQGFGVNATTGGPVSNRTGRGRQDYDDGGMVYLYDRKEMANGGEAESYADIIDAYNNGVGVLEGESLTDYIRRNRIKIMDPVEKANGGPISESDFPRLINRPGENIGRKKPGLSDYDRDTQDYDDEYDFDIIEIPMGKMMKKKTKKKKKAREDYSDGGRVYLYHRQD